jgi:hypothetical protein
MLVERGGTSSWCEIASNLPGRNARQCRDRWNHYLCKSSTTPWTAEEDRILLEKAQELGFRWTQIARCLPHRSDTDVRARCDLLSRSGAAAERGGESRDPPPQLPPPRAGFTRQPLPSLVVDPACPRLFPLDVFRTGAREPEAHAVADRPNGLSVVRN